MKIRVFPPLIQEYVGLLADHLIPRVWHAWYQQLSFRFVFIKITVSPMFVMSDLDWCQ